jgi:hypothetical protein
MVSEVLLIGIDDSNQTSWFLRLTGRLQAKHKSVVRIIMEFYYRTGERRL